MQGTGIDTKSDTIFWFRRDLRLEDNTALTHALKSGKSVQPIFIFDTNILDSLPAEDERVSFIYSCLKDLDKKLNHFGASLRIYGGAADEVFREIEADFPSLTQIFWNRDYSPYALKRDQAVKEILAAKGISAHSFKDHILLEPNEVLKPDGTPYTVFTPYAKKWRSVLTQSDTHIHTIAGLENGFCKSNYSFPSLESIGFIPQEHNEAKKYPDEYLLVNYADLRDFPAENGTSRVSVAIRFGIISLRELFNSSIGLSETYTNELIWREFYQMILWHFPHTVTEEFKPKYASIPWRNNEDDFKRWKKGKTGVALVDAGMRELNSTGFMHNRVRMVVASFLCKNLLIDWRWGEAYFAEKLMDYELASNIGGWQWAASCGCDAAPYFRVFNPETQAKRFDPKSEYIRRWVPEFENIEYQPMVDLKQSRKACIETYKMNLNQKA